MMKTICCLFAVLLVGVTSCTWDKSTRELPAITADTLTYQYKTLKQRAPDCGTKPDNDCTVIQIKYPVFKSTAALNDTVRRRAIALFRIYQKPDTCFKHFANHFMKAYQRDMVNRNSRMIYQLQTTATVVRQDSAMVTLELSGYIFQGGAHGSNLAIFINWDTKSHQNIRLKDIFKDNYQHPLDSVAEKTFRKQEKLSDTEPLKNNYFFARDKFALNNNFLITPMGLRFIYNQYEIKPYAAGKTELFIPYTQIKFLLRPNTVVSQYIK